MKDWMASAYSMHGNYKECILNFIQLKNPNGRDHFKDLGLYSGIQCMSERERMGCSNSANLLPIFSNYDSDLSVT
jgi:hypothetical protein